MRALQIVMTVGSYFWAALFVVLGTKRWIESDGTIAESRDRMIAIGLGVLAVVFWIIAANFMKSRLFSIGRIALLVAIFVAGVLVAMNWVTATTHSRSKRTTADLRDIAVAIESYNTDRNEYPAASSIDELAARLEPAYVHKLPRTDAWGFPLRYQTKGKQFWIGSAAKHGKWEHARLDEYTRGVNRSPDDDIVFSGPECVRCAP